MYINDTLQKMNKSWTMSCGGVYRLQNESRINLFKKIRIKK